jgi:hypothetical protein
MKLGDAITASTATIVLSDDAVPIGEEIITLGDMVPDGEPRLVEEYTNYPRMRAMRRVQLYAFLNCKRGR